MTAELGGGLREPAGDDGNDADPPEAGIGTPPEAGIGTPPEAGIGTPPEAGIGTPPEAGIGTEEARAIEAVLMVAEQPVPAQLLGQLLEIGEARVDALCAALAAHHDAAERGFVLVKVAGGWRFQSHPDLAPYVERFVLEGQHARLSAAALETLAIVAYKQPVSRAQVASIRGVNVDGVMRTLQHRGYIGEVARDPGPGNAVLYGTTPSFLEKLGMNSIDDLPPLADFVPGADVVEALEHGLRADSAPPDGDAGAAPG